MNIQLSGARFIFNAYGFDAEFNRIITVYLDNHR